LYINYQYNLVSSRVLPLHKKGVTNNCVYKQNFVISEQGAISQPIDCLSDLLEYIGLSGIISTIDYLADGISAFLFSARRKQSLVWTQLYEYFSTSF
jgi:hypothetical protein